MIPRCVIQERFARFFSPLEVIITLLRAGELQRMSINEHSAVVATGLMPKQH